jgi:hypothetical protein
MKRNCNICNDEIPEGRLKALPNTSTCVNCSSTNKVKAIIVTNGNTIEEVYETIQIIDDQSVLREINNLRKTGGGVTVPDFYEEGLSYDTDDVADISIKTIQYVADMEDSVIESIITNEDRFDTTDTDFIDTEIDIDTIIDDREEEW